MTFPKTYENDCPGRVRFYHIGHPEPVTLPRFIEGVKHACNLYGGEPEALATLRDLGQRVTKGEITAFEAAELYPTDLARRLREETEWTANRGPRLGGHCGFADGLKAGKLVRYAYGFTGAPPGGMAGRSGVPLAIAVQMILEGQITGKGVLAPEACIDPMPFFERYSKYWTTPPEQGRILSQVVEELD